MMSDIKIGGTFPYVAFAVAGGFALLAALVPSPTRLMLWAQPAIAPPQLNFPQAAVELKAADLDAIADRPLFNPDRKKDPPELPKGSLSGLDTYRLAGVLAVGSTGVAIIERRDTKATTTVRVGDTMDARVVAAITADGVTFTSATGSEMLRVPKVAGVNLSQSSDGQPGNTGHKREGRNSR